MIVSSATYNLTDTFALPGGQLPSAMGHPYNREPIGFLASVFADGLSSIITRLTYIVQQVV